MATSAHRAADYARDGYLIARGLLTAAESAESSRRLDRLLAAKPDVRPELLAEPHVEDAYWLELCRHPRLLAAVRAVLGDDLILLMTHAIVKPAGDGRRVGWHQDQPSWPSVAGTDIVTVWLAIDRSDVGNGCMRVIPRSHAGRRDAGMVPDEAGNVFNFRVEITPELAGAQVPVELEAGDVSLHDAFIIHGSEANLSPRRRGGFTMRYGSARSVHVDTSRHWVPVFLVSGEADPALGYLDLRPGRALPQLPLQAAGGNTARFAS